jgi:hypothetical protein
VATAATEKLGPQQQSVVPVGWLGNSNVLPEEYSPPTKETPAYMVGVTLKASCSVLLTKFWPPTMYSPGDKTIAVMAAVRKRPSNGSVVPAATTAEVNRVPVEVHMPTVWVM